MRHGIVYDSQQNGSTEKPSDFPRPPAHEAGITRDPRRSRKWWITTLDKTIGYCLAALLFILFFEHTNTTAAVLSISPFVLWISRMYLARDFRLVGTPVSLPLLALVIMAFISTIFSMDRLYSLDEFRGEILKQFMLFFTVANTMRTPVQIRNLLIGLFAGALCMSVIGIVGYYMGWTVFDGRTISLYSNMDYTALPCYLAICVALLLSIVYVETNRARKSWLIALMAGLVWCILLTFTRAVWIAVGMGGSLISLVHKKYKGLMVLAAIVIILAIFPNPFRTRLLSIADLRYYPVPGAILSDRVLAWRSALDMIEDRPYTGIGYGSELFKKIYPLYRYPGADEPMTYAHNLFLDITVQMGIPGLIIFLWLLAAYFRGAMAAFRKLSQPFLSAVILGSTTGILILVVSGLAHFMLFNELGLLAFMLMGIVFSSAVQEKSGTLEWNDLLHRAASRWVFREQKQTETMSE